MMRPIVKIVRTSGDAHIPSYAHSTDSGADLFSTHDVCLAPGETVLIHTGISIALPEGYEAQIRSKSGRALKESLFVLNSPGTIDNGYRGEICVIMHNSDNIRQYVVQGEKVAQLVITPYVQATFAEVGRNEFDRLDTARGDGGFGSTGLSGLPSMEDVQTWPFGYDPVVARYPITEVLNVGPLGVGV